MREKKPIQKLTVMLLCAIMVVGLIPVSALAETGTFSTGGEVTVFETSDSDIGSMPNSTLNTVTVVAFDDLPEEIRWQNTTAPFFPETVGGTVEGETVQIPVTWEADHAYDAEYPARGLYVFTAVLGEGYSTADNVELPRITVFIPQNAGMAARMAGSGTTDSPLEITTAVQLAEIALLVNARMNGLELFLFNDANAKVSLKLMNDIDLSAYAKGEGWIPIGSSEYPFGGEVDGGGHRITSLYISRNADFQGLFGGVANGGAVRNVGVENADITGKNYVGGVAGYANGMVENCYSTGTVSGGITVGGVVGHAYESTVQNCYSASAVSGSTNVGGVVGIASNEVTLMNCYSIGDISGATNVGGVVGRVFGGLVQNCAALNPSVTGDGVGRVAGDADSGTLSGNMAFDRMQVIQNGSAKTPDEGADKVDGASKTAANINAAGFFQALFHHDTVWTYEAHKLPGFGAATDMPEYIVDDSNPYFLGSGTSESPYQITTPAQLAKLAELVNAMNITYYAACYKLMNDIDLSCYGVDYDNGKGWVPVGRRLQPFRGIFYGNGKTITGLYINRSDEEHVGLFGAIAGGTVKNLMLQDVSVEGESCIGGVSGSVYFDGMVEGCSLSGTIRGEEYVGSVVGYVYAASVQNCYSTGSLTSTLSYAGGMVGRNNDGTVKNCYSIVSITGDESGGIVGCISNALVQNCAALNPFVTGVRYTGRVVGSVLSGTLSGNIAFDGMTVGGVTVSGGALTDKSGAAKSAAQISAAGFWTAVSGFSADWDTAVWTIEPGKLPILKGIDGQDASMPAHLYTSEVIPFAGSGTSESDPYLISMPSQLAKLAELVNSGTSPYADAGRYYKLVNDLDLSAYASGEGWMPIGKDITYRFEGIFDGNNKSITGLTINRSAVNYIGLFGYITNEVRDLSITNASVTGGSRVGGVAGHAWGATVENCAVLGDIAGVEYIGGVVGSASSGNIHNCYSTGSVVATGDNVGGAVGYLEYNTSTMEHCYSVSNVLGRDNVGGVAGQVGDATVQNCYSRGNVTGRRYTGGVAGGVDSGKVQNCYSIGSVSSTDSEGYIGGMLGYLGSGTLKNCVALNPSINAGIYNFGRLVGRVNGGTLSNNYAHSRMPGTWENKGLHAKDGADITLEALFGGNFWTVAGNWDGAAWDSDTWTFMDNKLPVLQGLSGQTGDSGLYLTSRDIRYATVDTIGSFTYNGSQQLPTLTVTFDGETLAKDTDYTVSITSTDGSGSSAGTNAGEVTLTMTGIGSFMGTKTVAYTIAKAPLTITSAAVTSKSYDGTTAAVVERVDFAGLQLAETLTLGTDYTVTNARFNSPDAGDNRTVTATVALADTQKASNYNLTNGSLDKAGFSISKAAAPAVPNIAKSVVYTDTAVQTVNIADNIASYMRAGDTLTFTVGTVSGANPEIIQTPSVSDAGVLNFVAKGAIGNSATIPIIVTGFGNYNDITVNVTVTLRYTPPVTDETTVYNAPSADAATIWLSGSDLSNGDSLIAKPVTSGSSYKAMLKLADKDDVLGMYDISLKSGKKSTADAMYLTFSIGAKYSGQTLTLVHQKADGSFEYFFAIADAMGNVKFGPLYELSPFMLVKGMMVYTPEYEVLDIPNTGDSGFPLWLIALSLSGVCAFLFLMRRRKEI